MRLKQKNKKTTKHADTSTREGRGEPTSSDHPGEERERKKPEQLVIVRKAPHPRQ